MTITDTKGDSPRDATGRFTGQGAFDSETPAPVTNFTSLADADRDLRVALEAADEVLASSGQDNAKVPTVVCRASPGAGKSRLARLLLAEKEKRSTDQHVSFHLPTLALAEEAASDARALGLDAKAIRGRSAPHPDGRGNMCARAELVERAGRLGLSAQQSFCRREETDGTAKLCPHFKECAYLKQFRVGARYRFLATAYLSLPDPAEKCDLRIVDETFWPQFLMIQDVSAAAFTNPRMHFPAAMAAQHASLLEAAKQVVAALMDNASPLTLPFSSEDYLRLSDLEWMGQAPCPDLSPDQNEVQQARLLGKAEQNHRYVSGYAALWRVLADAKAAGLRTTERLRLIVEGDAFFIRVLRRKPLRHKEPMLVLDADADTTILSALACDIRKLHDVTLRPNALVTQLHDRRMTKGSLLKNSGLRESWRRIIAREVLMDRLDKNAGVLVGATRKVVRAFFEDAGHGFEGMSEAEVSKFMLSTKLHGAQWLWFGGRALGSNRYQNCSTVIVIGREELPVSALEDQARALWGDTPGNPLDLLTPDTMGQTRMPEELTPYEMTDGTSKAVLVPCHPDPRVRRLQLQSRELSSRQLIERLRLARAKHTKKVIIGCNIPIPGIPVDRLVPWQALTPNRLDAAITDGLLENGAIRMSPQGLTDGAPRVFSSVEAARTFLKRGNQTPKLRSFLTATNQACPSLVFAKIKRAARYARTEVVVFLAQGNPTKETAERIWGELKHFRCMSKNGL
ncbi:hypothetical protein [Ruegeria sp. 6PALISEP08]|uniref:hypothetical protein n=1 Tax=Ruegeria sp. 6PALISEP08 TaxID=1225660 RepID=UPI00067E7C8A|nr:hypothetical protein [Ruegeria sp. 6PALISEP08]